jgi:hypothetical protein
LIVEGKDITVVPGHNKWYSCLGRVGVVVVGGGLKLRNCFFF